LRARLFSYGFKIIEDLTNRWSTDLDAVNWCPSSSLDLIIQVLESWIDASISKAMEDGCWDAIHLSVWILEVVSHILG
jgi:hypothetical protein